MGLKNGTIIKKIWKGKKWMGLKNGTIIKKIWKSKLRILWPLFWEYKNRIKSKRIKIGDREI
jgi:hypothetical protein